MDDYEGAQEIERAWRDGLTPDPLLTVSEWSDRHRMLSSKASAEPGRWRTSRTPYLKDIMDCLSPTSPVERVVFMKAAQLGATEMGSNWIGYVIHHAPGPMMAVWPTVEMAKRNSKQRIDPLIEESAALAELIAPARSRDSGNTILAKEFRGGVLVMTGANSAVGLRSMPVRYLFLDEVDGYPLDVEGEGDAISLAEARTRTFARRKIFIVSTPTISGASAIEREYEASDQRRYFVPCPHCNHPQWLRFEQLRWDKGQPETAAYVCESCGTAIAEHHKTWMLERGEWRAMAQDASPKTAGFHLSSLYSPVGWRAWRDIAAAWEAAVNKESGSAAAIKTFKNTELGETWVEEGEAPDWQRLVERREDYRIGSVPAGGLLLVAGADVQKDRIEVSVWAFGRGKESWLIEHRVLMGDTARDTVWKALAAMLAEQWTHACGAQMPLARLALDTGFATQEAYAFVRACHDPRVMAVKGVARGAALIGTPTAVDMTQGGKKLRRGIKVYSVAGGIAKLELYNNLRKTPEVAEDGVAIRYPTGFPVREWQKMRERNEALDCYVYARAITSAERSLGGFGSSAKSASDKAAAGMAEVKAGMSALGDQVAKAKTQLLAFLTINWVSGKAREIVQIADAWNMMSARLKLATAGSREYTVAQRELFAIAQRSGSSVQETATLYGKLQQAVRMLGGEQQDALALTESISQALHISGASATEAQSALLQFGQALASGVLRGEEFNSVAENSPRLAKALADGLNVPIGRLRKLAEEGRLTADVVVNALMSQKDKLAAEYAQLPMTVGQAFTRLSNAFGQWISRLDESTGFTKKLAEALTWLAENLDTVMEWLTHITQVGLAVLIYRLIPALIIAWQTAGAAAVTAASTTAAAWATANLSVSNAIATVGKLRVAFGVLGAAIVGWEIGTWLSEKFEIVRKAGIFMVQVLMTGIEHLRYQWEVLAAVFTSDTIAEATQRHKERLAEMNRIFAEMYADATEGANAAQGAMNTAATAAEEIAKRLEAVRQGTQEAVGRGIEAVHTALEKLKSRLGEVEQAVGKAQGVLSDATAKMADAYKGFNALAEANLQTQVTAVKARYDQEKAELERTQQSETAKITKSTQLLTDALTQQATLRRQATTETLGLIDQETQARREAAARQGQTEEERRANVQRVENDILATKRQTLTQALTEYRQHIDALNAEANRHLAEVQRIEEAKRQLSMSTEDRIRDIRRQGMTEYEATEDRKRQIAEMQAQARRALANGELELARQLAQKAMDMAAQVATSQTNEGKRAAEARKQSEQAVSQAAQLEAQSREAYRRQEYQQANDLMRQAGQLRAELAQKARDADAQAVQSKQSVRDAIDRIRQSEDILNQALDAEARAHQTAARTALSARDEIQRTLSETTRQVDDLTAKLKDGMKLTLDADTTRFNKALADLDKALAEKEYLLQIQADLQEAERQLKEYEALLKEGKTLPVDADVSKARDALDRLKVYADENAQFELKVATEKAQAAITNVDGMIKALDRIRTESHHAIQHNAEAARAEVMSLNGIHTTSTHTIYVTKVETNATGGLVGAGVQKFAEGGAVAAAFPRMSGGTVPGSGHHDTVPRTLDAGAFVIRKAAVRKYGAARLANLVQGVAHFARGGQVRGGEAPKRNRETAEALKMIDLGLQGMNEYTSWLRYKYGAAVSLTMKSDTMRYWGQLAQQDRRKLDEFIDRKTLTGNESQSLQRIKQRWRQAMAQPLLWGKDLERELIDYMEQNQGQFYRLGGLSRSDTVPAMLTPGEYVVRRDAVARLGVGFFEAINNLSAPAQALAGRTLASVQGFASGGLVQPIGANVPRPALTEASAPTRTVRVELAAGGRQVAATVDGRDEARLLQLLDAARARTT